MRPAQPATPIFDPSLLGFLRELRRNNDREWFAANKTRYLDTVLEPALRFVAAMEAPLRSVAPQFRAVARRQGGSVMRIYRDVRFARNREPYKTNVGIHFRHAHARDVHGPGYYVHIAPDEAFFGVGCWRPDRSALARIRERIATRPEDWRRARDAPGFRAVYTLGGASLKRPPRGCDPDHPWLVDLRRTDFLGVHQFDESVVCEPDFVAGTARAFAAARPFMTFLCRALELPC